MLNLLKKSGKVIVSELAIAFFFASILILLVNFTLKDKVTTYINLFNKVAVKTASKPSSDTNISLKIDSATQRLNPLPAYGDTFGTINIPNIDITINLYNGDSLTILKKGAGRYIGSFFPGEGLPIIIAAHNRLEYFGNLYKLNIGDEININTYYGNYTYSISKTAIFTEKELDQEFNIFLESDGENILLYTCYPTGGVGYRNKRYVVYAKKIRGTNL